MYKLKPVRKQLVTILAVVIGLESILLVDMARRNGSVAALMRRGRYITTIEAANGANSATTESLSLKELGVQAEPLAFEKEAVKGERSVEAKLKCEASHMALCKAVYMTVKAAEMSTQTVFDLDCAEHERWLPLVLDALTEDGVLVKLVCAADRAGNMQAERVPYALETADPPQNVDLLIGFESLHVISERVVWYLMQRIWRAGVRYFMVNSFVQSNNQPELGGIARHINFEFPPFTLQDAEFIFEGSNSTSDENYATIHVYNVQDLYWTISRKDLCEIVVEEQEDCWSRLYRRRNFGGELQEAFKLSEAEASPSRELSTI